MKHSKYIKRIEPVKKIMEELGFWYVDIPGTSSTSLRADMGNYYGMSWGFTKSHGMKQKDIYTYEAHIRAEWIQRFLGKKLWNSTFTFTIIRNPWERALSMYLFFFRGLNNLYNKTCVKAEKQRKNEQLISKALFFLMFSRGDDRSGKHFQDHIASLLQKHYPKMDLNAIMKYAPISMMTRKYPTSVRPMSFFIMDENKNLMVDYTIEYENRQEGLNYISKKINIPNLGKNYINTRIKKYNTPYQYYYDDDMRNLIAEVYKDDIAYGRYTFG